MFKYIPIIAILLLLTSCYDSEVTILSTEHLPQVHTEMEPCNYTSYCFSLNLKGKYGWGISVLCHGHQEVVFTVDKQLLEFTRTYLTGSKEIIQEVIENRNYISKGECHG